MYPTESGLVSYFGEKYKKAKREKRDELLRDYLSWKAEELLNGDRFLFSTDEWPAKVRSDSNFDWVVAYQLCVPQAKERVS